jgi:hypothetical protein
MRQMVDPRLHQQLHDHFPSRCTIQVPTFTTSASNQKIPGPPVNLQDHTDIPCRIGPIIEIRPTDDQIRQSETTEDYKRRQCKLNGFYPAIQEGMIALVDGYVYPVRGAEADGNGFSTRLKLEVVDNG